MGKSSSVDKVNRRPRRFRTRKAKTVNGRQNQRLAKLEKTVFTALERKSKTYQNGTWTISTTPRILNNLNTLVMNLAEGVTIDDRIGTEVCLLNTTIRYNLSIPDGGDAFNQVRMIVVEPKEGNVTLSLADVLEFGDPSTQDMEVIMASPYKIKTSQNNKGYKVHYDKVFELNAYASRCHTGEVKIKYGKSGKKIEYPPYITGSNPSQPLNHNLHIMLVSDSGSVLHPKCALTYRSRFFDA